MKSSPLSEFIRNATPEEKARVYGEVMEKACERQRQMIGVSVELPWPVSINRYLRRAGTVMHTTKEAKQYRKDVGWLCAALPRFGNKRLALDILAYPPDNRRRDLDNIQKVLVDSLMHAGLFDDDSQIDDIRTRRCEVRKNAGAVLVTLREAT